MPRLAQPLQRIGGTNRRPILLKSGGTAPRPFLPTHCCCTDEGGGGPFICPPGTIISADFSWVPVSTPGVYPCKVRLISHAFSSCGSIVLDNFGGFEDEHNILVVPLANTPITHYVADSCGCMAQLTKNITCVFPGCCPDYWLISLDGLPRLTFASSGIVNETTAETNLPPPGGGLFVQTKTYDNSPYHLCSVIVNAGTIDVRKYFGTEDYTPTNGSYTTKPCDGNWSFDCFGRWRTVDDAVPYLSYDGHIGHNLGPPELPEQLVHYTLKPYVIRKTGLFLGLSGSCRNTSSLPQNRTISVNLGGTSAGGILAAWSKVVTLQPGQCINEIGGIALDPIFDPWGASFGARYPAWLWNAKGDPCGFPLNGSPPDGMGTCFVAPIGTAVAPSG